MADQFTGRTIAEKYRIDSHIRAGEAGDLYRSTHLFMEKGVWIRVLRRELSADPETASRFFREPKAASQAAHANVLTVTDFGTDSHGYAYVVYEPAEGETLRDSIDRSGLLTVENAVEIARQTAAALAAMRSAGISHGNLSPEKILLAENGEKAATVKVIDFGSANAITADRDVLAAKANDFFYISPEQCAGIDAIDERSDIYSLGVTFFEMLAGEVPFSGEKPTDVMLRHIEEPPPPLSAFRKDLPPEIETVVLKALAKNPEMRYQTADELLVDLDPARVADGEAKARSASGGFWSTALLSVIGIALLASALIYATSSKTADPLTQLQPDANGVPVQPINPATGVEEQNLMAMPGIPNGMMDANSMSQPPGTLAGGDGYNAWATGQPPAGAPPQNYVPPGGQVYTIDPNNPSQFMPMDGGVVLVPIPANTVAEKKPTPTPKTPAANSNTALPTEPTPKPAATKPPAPVKTPAAKPERSPDENSVP